ncbi:UvrD-helicase domain-containing protein [bacterium]|nr:UvrD-helicase domain-containing protein [bacterium]
MQSLDGLNEKQKEAVLHTEGPLLIVAGAGAGKTKTLTHRILHLVSEGVPGSSILAITFTNKAAREMRERVNNLLQQDETGENFSSSPLSPNSFHEFGRAPAQSRQKNILPSRPLSYPFISTFHSLGVNILKRHGERMGLPRYFTILDKGDSLAIVREVLKEKGVDPKQFDPKRIRDTISREKGEAKTVETYREESGNAYYPKIAAEAWLAYERILKDRGALDFDDLLVKTLFLLREYPEVREWYQNLWRYVHIDEYQDTNAVQYEISKLLVESHKNICVVGDADQNIYSWRGANIKNILSFEKDFSGAKVVLLEENYRSTKTILDAANAVIVKNAARVPKNLFTSRDGGERIGVYEAYDETNEAQFVAEKTGELLGKGVRPEEIAVLFRANYQSRALEEAFLSSGIPYQMLGTRFFERKEVKDVLSYLRAALNPKSRADIERCINVPPRGIGDKTLQKIFASGRKESVTDTSEERLRPDVLATEKSSGALSALSPAMREKVSAFFKLLEQIREIIAKEKPSEAVRRVIVMTGMQQMLKNKSEEDAERLENILELASLAAKYDTLPIPEGMEKLLEEAALMSDQDALMLNNPSALSGTSPWQGRRDGASPPAKGEMSEAQRGSVKLMTVHASKGLEFSHVFITGLEDGLFPHKAMSGSDGGREREEEERRLFYVALTRAKEKLCLTHASVRTVFGGRQINLPSEFLFDIPEDILEQEMIQ